jgi:Ser/Thr protein kinase RdoA (MazF antagonist)
MDWRAEVTALLTALRDGRSMPPALRAERLGQLGVAPLGGGRHNRVYAWERPNGPVCVKVYRTDGRHRVQREWHALTLLAAHQVTAAPLPLWLDPDPDQPAIGMTMVPGRSLTEITDHGAALPGLVAALRGIHDLPVDGVGGLPRIDSADHQVAVLRASWAKLLDARPRDALTLELLGRLASWWDSGDPAALAEPAERVFSRGDANLLNWLWDGSTTRCVDFEYCGWSDLAFDAAELMEHLSARTIDDAVWVGIIAQLGVGAGMRRRFLAARRTCALRWLADLWRQRDGRAEVFAAQLDRVRRLQRDDTGFIRV